VDDIKSTVAKLRQRGIKVEDIRVGNSRSPLTNFVDPNGVRIELLEYPVKAQWTATTMETALLSTMPARVAAHANM
jgi:hypothetical protein